MLLLHDENHIFTCNPAASWAFGTLCKWSALQPMTHNTYSRFCYFQNTVKKVKVAHTRLPSIGFRSWSRFLAVSLQATWVINPAVSCHYFPPGLQLPQQPLRGLLPVLLLGEQRHDGCEQFAHDCYLTALRLRFEPGPFCAWVQHANHSATETPSEDSGATKEKFYL